MAAPATKGETENPDRVGEVVAVVYADRSQAKMVKSELERKGILNKDFRMASAAAFEGTFPDCIALPVIAVADAIPASKHILGSGTQFCYFSTSLLGNHMQRIPRKHGIDSSKQRLTLVQRALLCASEDFAGRQSPNTMMDRESIQERILSLNIAICPRNLELLGDDNTLVLNRRNFDPTNDHFMALLQHVGCQNAPDKTEAYLIILYENLMRLYQSPRLVRKGKVDPASRVRESGYQLTWPFRGVPAETGRCMCSRRRTQVYKALSHSFILPTFRPKISRMDYRDRARNSTVVRLDQSDVQPGQHYGKDSLWSNSAAERNCLGSLCWYRLLYATGAGTWSSGVCVRLRMERTCFGCLELQSTRQWSRQSCDRGTW
jgi:hypothetical protein